MIDNKGINKSAALTDIPPVDRSPDVQTFETVAGTYYWNKPDGCSVIHVVLKQSGSTVGTLQHVVLADDVSDVESVVVSTSPDRFTQFGDSVLYSTGDVLEIISFR